MNCSPPRKPGCWPMLIDFCVTSSTACRWRTRQTHTIPVDRQARERLARLMGFASLKAFESAHKEHTRDVRRLFEKILQAEVPGAEAPSPLPREFKNGDLEWKSMLTQ